MYPAIEIHLHLGHVCAAHRQVLAAFGYAFRPLHPGTNLLPRQTNPAGEPSDILIAAGQVIITGEVGPIGYNQIFVVGQVLAPEAAQTELEPRMEAPGRAYRSWDLDPR